jgi:hypothetical protein
MQRGKWGFPAGVLAMITVCMAVLVPVGCSHKPGYLTGMRTDIPQRWKVEQVTPGRLSPDQRSALEELGPPTYVRFFRQVETRAAVHAWIYGDTGENVEVIWFVGGKRVEDIAVDSNPSAFSSTTRRRTRLGLLFGTGAAILPTVLLLANK